jgi:hypothetical protein
VQNSTFIDDEILYGLSPKEHGGFPAIAGAIAPSTFDTRDHNQAAGLIPKLLGLIIKSAKV